MMVLLLKIQERLKIHFESAMQLYVLEENNNGVCTKGFGSAVRAFPQCLGSILY